MQYSKSKSTQRFNFTVSRNTTSKKAGSNTLTIGTNQLDGKYAMPTTSMTMTVKEARALNSFLNQQFSSVDQPES